MTLFISQASRCTPGREGDERQGDDVRAMTFDVVQGDGMCQGSPFTVVKVHLSVLVAACAFFRGTKKEEFSTRAPLHV